MATPVVVAYGRTPCCRARKGGLADMHPIDYAAQALKGVIAKVPYIQEHPEEIGDVITGCAMAINELNLNAGRLIVNRAEPSTVSALPVCRLSLPLLTQSLLVSTRSASAAALSA